jgi:hypothetical protein
MVTGCKVMCVGRAEAGMCCERSVGNNLQLLRCAVPTTCVTHAV